MKGILYASRDFNPEILAVYEKIEIHLKGLNELLVKEADHNSILTQINKKLSEENEKLIRENSSLREEVLTKINSRRTHGRELISDLPTFQQEFLERTLDQMKDELGKTCEENINLRKHIKELKQEIKNLLPIETNSLKLFVERGTQVTLSSKELTHIENIPLNSYITKPEINQNGTKLPKDLLDAIINSIYSEKIITDFHDDFERRPHQSFANFVVSWFLQKFGYSMVGKLFLKDFMYTLINTTNKDRYRVFKELLGIQNDRIHEIFKFSIQGGDNYHPDRFRLKKVAMSTSQILQYFFKIINEVKEAWLKEMDLSSFSKHKSYLPNFESTEDFISIATAKRLLLNRCKELKLNIEETRDAEDHLYFLQHSSKNRNQGSSIIDHFADNEDDVGFLKIDKLLRFLLELYVERQLDIIEKIYTAFKIHISSKKSGDICYEDFMIVLDKIMPKETKAWKDHAFGQMMKAHTLNKLPFINFMENFIPSYFNEGQVQETVFHEEIRRSTDKVKEVHTPLKKLDGRTPKSPGTPKPGTFTSTFHQSLSSQAASKPMKKKILLGFKELFSSNDEILNDFGYANYDVISSLIILQESYEILEDKIVLAEKHVEGLINIHEDLLRDLEIIPKRLCKIQKKDALDVYTKQELVDFTEHLWTAYRSVLFLAFRPR